MSPGIGERVQKRTERLPINSDKLSSHTPAAMWFIVGRVEPQTLGIPCFQDLIRRTFAQREHVLGRINFFLVDTVVFHTNDIYEERNNMRRHFHFEAVRLGGGVIRR